ncbi:MAG TPA: hypothetical protein VF487_03230 [Chitinophagaceae bacterium]
MKQKLFILLGILIGVTACQKKADSFEKNEVNHVTNKFNYNRFFPESQSNNPTIKRIFEYLKSENSKKDFLSEFVKIAGYPRWDKIILKEGAEMHNTDFVNNKFYQETDTLCIIPLVTENNTAISGVLIAELLNGQINCHYSLVNNYNEMGELKRKFVLSMIQFEKFVFGHTTFKIYDNALLGNANTILLKKGQPKNSLTKGQMTNTLDDPCEIIEIWYDPTAEECHCTGDEYYTGEWYYQGDCFASPTIPYILPLDGGGSFSLPSTDPGGGSGGGSNNPPYASTFTEKLNYLLNQLDMTPESSDFLPTSEPTVNEMYHYLYSNPTDERKEITSDHIQKLAIDPDYSSFVAGYRTYSGNSNTQWWENQSWLDDPTNFHLDITQANNQYDKLTAAEKVLVGLYPLQAYIIKQNVSVAMNTSAATGLPNPLNGKQDAFRHAFFQAINTRDVPPRIFGPNAASGSQIVSMFAIAHESKVPSQLELEKKMDIFNNNVGISYCWNCWTTSNSSISNAIMTKLNNGELRYIKPLDFTSSPNYDANGDGVQDCSTCLNGILSTSVLTPTSQ